MTDPQRPQRQTTLVGFHDLLGFGELVASSGGTLDSAVGELAHRRIVALRRSVLEVRDAFPEGTSFFHFNDTVTAYLDLDVQIHSSHTDSAGMAVLPLDRNACLKMLNFIAGCATLHQRSIAREEEERIGPAGRTFVVLGSRWDLGESGSHQIFEVPPLQANLAFSEAYLADQAGSRAGFSHRSFCRFYANDYVWLTLCAPLNALGSEERIKLDSIGTPDKAFPMNISTPEAPPISVEIFHRRRTFYSLMSHHAEKIRGALI